MEKKTKLFFHRSNYSKQVLSHLLGDSLAYVTLLLKYLC